MSFAPTYSHGGPAALGRAAVPGNVTGPGRTIQFADGCVGKACLTIICTGGSAVVKVESNGGVVTNGEPPAAEWADISAGGFSMVSGDIFKKGVPVSEPYVRTNIVSVAGANVTSYVSLARDDRGIAHNAGAPIKISTQSEF